jgi:hypothetical protein
MNIFDQIINAIRSFLQAIVDIVIAFLRAIADFFVQLFSVFS